jgi:glycosyltransferase involved in cell wall biosynthesis
MKNTSKIKILETIRQGQVGGGETHVLDLVGKMDKTRFEVEVLSFTEGPMVDKLNAMGIKTYVIKTEKPFDFKIWKAVTELMRLGNYNIIHAHGTRAASNVFYSAKKLGVQMIYTVHGWSFHNNQSFLVRTFRELSESFLTKNAAITITVSESNKYDGVKKFGLKRSQVIYNGIDGNKFDPNAVYPNIRKELGIAENVTLVGYLVRMTHQKDPFTMIRAVKKVSETNKNINFLLIGNGDLIDDTKKLAADLGVLDQIIFSDFRSDIPAVLNAIDIYCLPSLWEGMPIGMLEAMAMGKACIATGVDGTKELVNDGVNGLLINIKDHNSLAKQIIDLHLQSEKRKNLGLHAQQYIKENFSLTEMVSRIESLYLKIVPGF